MAKEKRQQKRRKKSEEPKDAEVPESIYTPAKAPGKAMVLISFIVAVGILGTLFISKFFMIFATIFWIQYTAILSYLQFKHGRKYKRKNFFDHLLNPQIRLFVFGFLGTIGLLGALSGLLWAGYIVLVAWWLFSLNFYFYFEDFKKYM